MIIRKRNLFIAGVLLTLISFSGCWDENNVNPTEKKEKAQFNFDTLQAKASAFKAVTGKRGGTLRLPQYNEPKSFNPITHLHAIPHMFEGLVKIDDVTGDPVPWLCEKWEVSDDQLTWKFYIRKDILWSDSVQFLAYDVEFTFNKLIYNRRIKPNKIKRTFTIADKTIEVKALDSLIVQCVLPSRDGSFIRYMSQEILPQHIYGRAVKKGGFSDLLGLDSDLTKLVGTGPFLLHSYASYNNLVYVRNPLYWKTDETGLRLPYLDSIVYVLVSDIDDALRCLKDKEIDYLSVTGKDYADFSPLDSEYTTVFLGPALGCNALMVNQNSGHEARSKKPYLDPVKQKWFTNKNFRKALSFAMNRQKLIDSLFSGMGHVQRSPISEGSGSFYYNDCADYSYNLEKAKSLLAAEGFKDNNGDGILEDSESNPVQLALYVNNGNIVRKKMAELIIEDYKKLGIAVDLHAIDAKIIEQRLFHPPYDWDMVMVGFTGGKDPLAAKEIWHSKGHYHLWDPVAENEIPWQTTVDSLFDAAAKEPDVNKRKLFFSLWQKIASDELPLIFTVQSERILIMSTKIKNVNPTIYGGLLHNIEELYKVN